jgi:pyridoxine 4-dehydrogenase
MPNCSRKLPPVIKLLQEIAQNHGKTVSQVALNWVICKGALPIPGAKNAKQAEDERRQAQAGV